MPVGAAMLFSATQLHATIPNYSGRTRWSIDFRTVHRGDLEADIGASWVDEACTGTCLWDQRSVETLEFLPSELIDRFDPPETRPADAVLRYVPAGR